MKEEYSTNKRPSLSMVYDPRATKFQCAIEAEIDMLRDNLSDAGKNAAFLHIIPLSDSILSKTGTLIIEHVMQMFKLF